LITLGLQAATQKQRASDNVLTKMAIHMASSSLSPCAKHRARKKVPIKSRSRRKDPIVFRMRREKGNDRAMPPAPAGADIGPFRKSELTGRLTRKCHELRPPMLSVREQPMDTVSEFRKQVAVCKAMAKVSADPDTKAAWQRMAERWLVCSKLAEDQVSAARRRTENQAAQRNKCALALITRIRSRDRSTLQARPCEGGAAALGPVVTLF
jgi:hypothetical protein